MNSNRIKRGGYVYVFENSLGEFKVGSTNNVKNRISNIRCGCPSAKVVFESELLSNHKSVEKLIHDSISEYRTGGEWFGCGKQLVISNVKREISLNGDIIDEDQIFNNDAFDEALEWSKIQATGVLCSSHSKTHKHIIDRYTRYLESTSLNQLSAFNRLCDAEKFVQSATVLASTFIRDETRL